MVVRQHQLPAVCAKVSNDEGKGVSEAGIESLRLRVGTSVLHDRHAEPPLLAFSKRVVDDTDLAM